MLWISLVEVYECVGNYVISLIKRLKRANRCILRQRKSWENVLVLWFIHDILKTMHLQLLKGMQSSILGMWKGYHLSIDGIQKGECFCQKRYIKEYLRGRTSGWSLPVYHFSSTPRDVVNSRRSPKNERLLGRPNVFPVVALLHYLITSLRGRRSKRNGKGKFPLPPSPSPFNAGHAGYLITEK